MRIDKARDPADQFHVVARQLGLDHVHFGLDHVLDAKRQVRHGDLVLDAIIHAIDVLVVIAGKMKHGLAKGLAGNCACIDTHSAHNFTALHQRHAFAHLGALDGRALARRSGTDNNKIVGLHRETNLTQEGSLAARKGHYDWVSIVSKRLETCQNWRPVWKLLPVTFVSRMSASLIMYDPLGRIARKY